MLEKELQLIERISSSICPQGQIREIKKEDCFRSIDESNRLSPIDQQQAKIP